MINPLINTSGLDEQPKGKVRQEMLLIFVDFPFFLLAQGVKIPVSASVQVHVLYYTTPRIQVPVITPGSSSKPVQSFFEI